MLQDFGAWNAARDARYPRIIDYLRQLSGAPRALVIHGNYLDHDDIDFLARRADRKEIPE